MAVAEQHFGVADLAVQARHGAVHQLLKEVFAACVAQDVANELLDARVFVVSAHCRFQEFQTSRFVAAQELGLRKCNGGEVSLGAAHRLARARQSGQCTGLVARLDLCLRLDGQSHVGKLWVMSMVRHRSVQQRNGLLQLTGVGFDLRQCQGVLRLRGDRPLRHLGNFGETFLGCVQVTVAVSAFTQQALAPCRRHDSGRVPRHPHGTFQIALGFQALGHDVKGFQRLFTFL